jgi:cell division septum initiation protein DivIVA
MTTVRSEVFEFVEELLSSKDEVIEQKDELIDQIEDELIKALEENASLRAQLNRLASMRGES